MKSVYITRTIPETGIKILRDKGYAVDVGTSEHPPTKEELIKALKAKPYDAVLTLLTDHIDAEVMDAAPSVKIFANFAIGYDNMDVAEGKKRGIFMTNTPHGGSDRVAEHAWGLILALTCRIVEADAFVRHGKYAGWDPMIFQGMKVRGKVLGLIGAGRIGSEVARIGAQGFGTRVVYTDVKRNEDLERLTGATFCTSPDDVLKQADFVSLHTPLMDSTRHLLNADRLKKMKPTAYVINTSRGGVIDEAALIQALKDKTIAGAGLDVYEHEPEISEALTELTNVVLTPHIASSTLDAREDMARISTANIIAVLEGGVPLNLVYN